MDPIILWVEMGRTAEAAANIDRYRHPLIPGRSDLGGRRRTSADKLLLSAGEISATFRNAWKVAGLKSAVLPDPRIGFLSG